MKNEPETQGVVTETVESAWLGISYAYEDLGFLEHNAFLLEFTANDKEFDDNRKDDPCLMEG